MCQIRSFKVLNAQGAKHIINEGRGQLDVWITLNRTGRFKARERKPIDELLERNSELKTKTDRNGKTMKKRMRIHAPHLRISAVKIKKDFP